MSEDTKMRQEFEAWAEDEEWSIARDDWGYTSPGVESMWKGWQACASRSTYTGAGALQTVAFHDKDQPNGIAWCPGYPEKLGDITPLLAAHQGGK